MSKPMVNIKRPCYAMATVNENSAEITMYGDIVSEQPTDWWGDPIEGSYIMQSEFLEDLEQIANCTDITIRMNSCGGDAGVSVLIHNRLRELADNGAKLTCIVDGVAMSGGSLIMCACDTVKVNPSSLVMIHKCWTFLFGGYNADDLRNQAKTNDAYDKSQVSIYKRKTGLTDTKILHMMADTTYMTGIEAVENCFADEVLENAEPLDIAASADRHRLFVGGREMHFAPGMVMPDNIPTVNPEAKTSDMANNNKPQANPATEGGTIMAQTVEQFRSENPELVAQLESDIRAAMTTEATDTAVQAERDRIKEIDEVASLFDSELVQAAKYGENACSAQELAYRAAKQAAEKGHKFMTDVNDDATASGTADVGAAPGTDDGNADDGNSTPEQKMANARAEVANLLGKKKED